MSSPYFRRGIQLGDRIVTTTGVSYVTDSLRFADPLLPAWMERNAVTGSAIAADDYHTWTPSTGYFKSKKISLKDPSQLIEYESGDRDAMISFYPRQGLQLDVAYLTIAEHAEWQRFYMVCQGKTQVVEYVDEYANALPGRIIGVNIDHSPERSASQPYNLSITFELEHVSETYTIRAGGQMEY